MNRGNLITWKLQLSRRGFIKSAAAAGWAYSIGYIKALLGAVSTEKR